MDKKSLQNRGGVVKTVAEWEAPQEKILFDLTVKPVEPIIEVKEPVAEKIVESAPVVVKEPKKKKKK